MSTIFTKAWVLDSLERAVKAFAGAILAGFGSNAIDLNALQANAVTVVVRAAILAATSVLLSVASAPARGISPASILPPKVAGEDAGLALIEVVALLAALGVVYLLVTR